MCIKRCCFAAIARHPVIRVHSSAEQCLLIWLSLEKAIAQFETDFFQNHWFAGWWQKKNKTTAKQRQKKKTVDHSIFACCGRRFCFFVRKKSRRLSVLLQNWCGHSPRTNGCCCFFFRFHSIQMSNQIFATTMSMHIFGWPPAKKKANCHNCRRGQTTKTYKWEVSKLKHTYFSFVGRHFSVLMRFVVSRRRPSNHFL